MPAIFFIFVRTIRPRQKDAPMINWRRKKCCCKIISLLLLCWRRFMTEVMSAIFIGNYPVKDLPLNQHEDMAVAVFSLLKVGLANQALPWATKPTRLSNSTHIFLIFLMELFP